ncbi:MAG: hypothetical protein U9R57_16435 [Thermodesulfobacteriota bacterium]|nr:hypothetical protein [Thermodesulfobacteriota bacterium]
MDDNLFDDDDALDYILYEDCEKNEKGSGGPGCLGILVGLMMLPSTAFVVWKIIQTVTI